MLGGDFNEFLYLDWKENIKNLWDYNGMVVWWDCFVLFENVGFKDVYWMKYFNLVIYLGFIFLFDNEGVLV